VQTNALVLTTTTVSFWLTMVDLISSLPIWRVGDVWFFHVVVLGFQGPGGVWYGSLGRGSSKVSTSDVHLPDVPESE
jgi:hypothetical protein